MVAGNANPTRLNIHIGIEDVHDMSHVTGLVDEDGDHQVKFSFPLDSME